MGNQSLLGVFVRSGDSSRVTTLIGLAIAAVVALLGTLVAAHWWRLGYKAFGVALAGLTTCLVSPLSWTHHYVWILPFAVALFSPGLPRWVRYVGGFWVIWVCACLPLALLPYGRAVERQYDGLQELVANLGPVVGVPWSPGWPPSSWSAPAALARAGRASRFAEAHAARGRLDSRYDRGHR